MLKKDEGAETWQKRTTSLEKIKDHSERSCSKAILRNEEETEFK